ncbi:MAG: hypothetical protein EOP06_32585 [Proteobacteria bacterium]|nr:MAG: hypothetical protein EOP06_32585 [Pseudomonadota bacterium]
MKIDANTSLRELAFIVCTAMDKANAEVVLSGGGAATVYAPDAYQSRDLDFIFAFWSSFGISGKPLLDLGFRKENDLYRHDLTRYTVEFPAGPLAVGGEEIMHWNTLKEDGLLLRILTPTDCVRDRLSWFLLEGDYPALEQALAVATRTTIDLQIIEKWCKAEKAVKEFQIFEERYRRLTSKTQNPKP